MKEEEVNHSEFESVELFPSTSLIFSKTTSSINSLENFIYSYKPSSECSVSDKCPEEAVTEEKEQEEVESTIEVVEYVKEANEQVTSTDAEMLKTSYNRPSLMDKFNQAKTKFNEIDVIGKLGYEI